ncbi:adenylate kinase [Vibrio alfacsensis]|uniref:adenylate kinase n=1 Tax=Vibrio alfacsensis TaxID=1074311 RepID=UPI001BEEF451|nr:adenylate kinase [Vibrio alfacsensis]BCN26019.1 adenylate kinase [Vibrio alfacsensis]
MRRINVVGSSGSGKSTFSQKLADTLDVTYIEMDELFWLPNWEQRDDESFFEQLKNETQRDSWVLDGNYTRTQAYKWERVDTIIWLDYSRSLTMYRSITRSIKRAWTKQELWSGTGNRESFRKAFLNKDSVILWSIQNYKSRRERYLRLKVQLKDSPIKFIHITSPKMADEFLSLAKLYQ